MRKYSCGGLTLAGGQVLTEAALSLPSSAGQGGKNMTKVTPTTIILQHKSNTSVRSNQISKP